MNAAAEPKDESRPKAERKRALKKGGRGARHRSPGKAQHLPPVIAAASSVYAESCAAAAGKATVNPAQGLVLLPSVVGGGGSAAAVAREWSRRLPGGLVVARNCAWPYRRARLAPALAAWRQEARRITARLAELAAFSEEALLLQRCVARSRARHLARGQRSSLLARRSWRR